MAVVRTDWLEQKRFEAFQEAKLQLPSYLELLRAFLSATDPYPLIPQLVARVPINVAICAMDTVLPELAERIEVLCEAFSLADERHRADINHKAVVGARQRRSPYALAAIPLAGPLTSYKRVSADCFGWLADALDGSLVVSD